MKLLRHARMLACLVLVGSLLGACSIGPTLSLPPLVQTSLVNDFAAAQANFTAAGMTTEAACMSDAITKLNVPAGVPAQNKGLISLGSIAYISVAQIQTLLGQGPSAVGPNCLQIIGKVVVSINQMNVRGLGALGGAAILAPK